MAAKEIYDYVGAVTPDVDVTLSLEAQGEISEESLENCVIHLGDDGSEERIALSTTPVFFVTFGFNVLSAADSGTLLDLYHTSACGMALSFKWTAYDGHTYVVRFDTNLTRAGQAMSRLRAQGIRLKILGRIDDP